MREITCISFLVSFSCSSRLIHLANFKRAQITNVHRITTKQIIASIFKINVAWGKLQECDTSLSLALNRKASLRMVCSAQYHLITIFKEQIRGEGRTFHRAEGEAVLRHFLTRATNQALFVRNNRLATESATSETLLASIYLFLCRIGRLLLMENVGPKMTMAPVYLRARNYRVISCYCG